MKNVKRSQPANQLPLVCLLILTLLLLIPKTVVNAMDGCDPSWTIIEESVSLGDGFEYWLNNGGDTEEIDHFWTINGDTLDIIVLESGDTFDLDVISLGGAGFMEVCLYAVGEDCIEDTCQLFQPFCPIEMFEFWDGTQYIFTHSNEYDGTYTWDIGGVPAGTGDSLLLTPDPAESYVVCNTYTSDLCEFRDCFYINSNECTFPPPIELEQGTYAFTEPGVPSTLYWILEGDTIGIQEGYDFQWWFPGSSFLEPFQLSECGDFEFCQSYMEDPDHFSNPCSFYECYTLSNTLPSTGTWTLTHLEESNEFVLESSFSEANYVIVYWEINGEFIEVETTNIGEAITQTYILNPTQDNEVCARIVNQFNESCGDEVCFTVQAEDSCGEFLFVENPTEVYGPETTVFYAFPVDSNYEQQFLINGEPNEEMFFGLQGADSTLYEICVVTEGPDCFSQECVFKQNYCPVTLSAELQGGSYSFSHDGQDYEQHHWSINGDSISTDEILQFDYEEGEAYEVCVHFQYCEVPTCYYINSGCALDFNESFEAYFYALRPFYPGTYTWTAEGQILDQRDFVDQWLTDEENIYYFYELYYNACDTTELCLSFVSNDDLFNEPCSSEICQTIIKPSIIAGGGELSQNEEGAFILSVEEAVVSPSSVLIYWYLNGNLVDSDELEGGDIEAVFVPEIDGDFTYEVCSEVTVFNADWGMSCSEINCIMVEGTSDCPDCFPCDENADSNPACNCSSLTFEAEIICEGNSTYILLLNYSSDSEAGHSLINNMTGESSQLPASGVYTQSGLVWGSGFSYSLISNSDPSCSAVAAASLIDCISTAIELFSFEGQALRKGNQLDWQTASEQNCERFILQRSENGTDFYTISELNCQLQSNTMTGYKYLDSDYRNATSYYRLLEKEVSGSVEKVSDVIVIEREKTMDCSIYPNPTTDILNIELQQPFETEFLVEIYDLKGQLLYSDSGYNSMKVELDISTFATGMYLLNIKSVDQLLSKRFVKQAE